jgi:hypothetical protein
MMAEAVGEVSLILLGITIFLSTYRPYDVLLDLGSHFSHCSPISYAHFVATVRKPHPVL